jgi:hypothetical protein
MSNPEDSPEERPDPWSAGPETGWHQGAQQSLGQWVNQGAIVLFYLALALSIQAGIPAWMELLGLKSVSAGGGAALAVLIISLPAFLAACLLYLFSLFLPAPTTLHWAQRYRKPALLAVLAWHVAFFLLDILTRSV